MTSQTLLIKITFSHLIVLVRLVVRNVNSDNNLSVATVLRMGRVPLNTASRCSGMVILVSMRLLGHILQILHTIHVPGAHNHLCLSHSPRTLNKEATQCLNKHNINTRSINSHKGIQGLLLNTRTTIPNSKGTTNNQELVIQSQAFWKMGQRGLRRFLESHGMDLWASVVEQEKQWAKHVTKWSQEHLWQANQ